ncbi:hypothetical protein J3R83DRAFT_10103 [Lanmaoa asiatica]|nr:hypothetical protein J3R83DRAFT_10103 [Lanmaoa asiatica]
MPVDLPDAPNQLFIGGDQSVSRERMLTLYRTAWEGYTSREYTTADEWTAGLTQHLEMTVGFWIARVWKWLDQTRSRFQQTAQNGRMY